jgi:hypothetical protein
VVREVAKLNCNGSLTVFRFLRRPLNAGIVSCPKLRVACHRPSGIGFAGRRKRLRCPLCHERLRPFPLARLLPEIAQPLLDQGSPDCGELFVSPRGSIQAFKQSSYRSRVDQALPSSPLSSSSFSRKGVDECFMIILPTAPSWFAHRTSPTCRQCCAPRYAAASRGTATSLSAALVKGHRSGNCTHA